MKYRLVMRVIGTVRPVSIAMNNATPVIEADHATPIVRAPLVLQRERKGHTRPLIPDLHAKATVYVDNVDVVDRRLPHESMLTP